MTICNSATCARQDTSDLVCLDECDESSAGCICDKGFVRNERTDECVEVSECPNYYDGTTGDKCGGRSNQEWAGCGRTQCNHKTCNNPNSLNADCTDDCIPDNAGCVCTGEYVLDEETNECVLLTDCPNYKCSFKPYKKYMGCGINGCNNPTCEKPDTSDMGCAAVCLEENAGCVCTGGYVLDGTTDDCVLVKSCPNASD